MTQGADIFFVVGLPRTRTAWLANLLTTGPSFCFHDVTAEVRSVEELPPLAGLLQQEGRQYVGFADSGLPLQADRLQELFPAARWVIVRRDRTEALESFLEYFRRHRYEGLPAPDRSRSAELFEQLDADLDRLAANLPLSRCFHTRFEMLGQEYVAATLMRFACPGLPWDARRWALLESLRINTIPEKRNVSKILEN